MMGYIVDRIEELYNKENPILRHAVEKLITKELEAVKNRVCEWEDTFDEDEFPYYVTKCGYESYDKDNYCPYCGGKIEIKSEVE